MTEETKKFVVVQNWWDFQDFCSEILREASPNCTFLVTPIARRKYNEKLPTRCQKFHRLVISDSDPEQAQQKLDRTYALFPFFACSPYYKTVDDTTLHDGKEEPETKSKSEKTETEETEETGETGEETAKIPADSIVFYMTLNPRFTALALTKLAAALMEDETKKERKTHFRLDGYIHDELHRTPKAFTYTDLDIDCERDIAKLTQLVAAFDRIDLWPALAFALETRGGYHLVLKSDFLTRTNRKQLWEFRLTCQCTKDKDNDKDKGELKKPSKKVAHKYWFSIDDDSMVPLPGTRQGGFLVRLIREPFSTYVSALAKKSGTT